MMWAMPACWHSLATAGRAGQGQGRVHTNKCNAVHGFWAVRRCELARPAASVRRQPQASSCRVAGWQAAGWQVPCPCPCRPIRPPTCHDIVRGSRRKAAGGGEDAGDGWRPQALHLLPQAFQVCCQLLPLQAHGDDEGLKPSGLDGLEAGLLVDAGPQHVSAGRQSRAEGAGGIGIPGVAHEPHRGK